MASRPHTDPRRGARRGTRGARRRPWAGLAALLVALPVTAVGSPADAAPSAPPTGNRGLIAFGHEGDIWVMDGDGSDRRNVTNSPDAHENSPTWSPDGQRIAYSRKIDRGSLCTTSIWVTALDGSDAQPITDPDGCDFSPSWSPDGAHLAIIRSNDRGTSKVFVVDADGGNPRELTTSTVQEWAPDWSPDGQRISYTTGAARTIAVHHVAADGSDLVTVAQQTHMVERDATWSPDSRLLAFSGVEGPVISSLDGTQRHELHSPVGFHSPDWSPDGTLIAYTQRLTSSPDDTYAIKVVGVDDSGPFVLGPGHGPEWQPVAQPTPTTLRAHRPGWGLLSVTTRATLLDEAGTPVAGRPVRFTAGSNHLCSATTDAAGVATCPTDLLGWLAVLLGNGYQASFAGDTAYRLATGRTTS